MNKAIGRFLVSHYTCAGMHKYQPTENFWFPRLWFLDGFAAKPAYKCSVVSRKDSS